MEIIISNSSDKPIYEQIAMQIKSLIMNGTLSAGEARKNLRKTLATIRKMQRLSLQQWTN